MDIMNDTNSLFKLLGLNRADDRLAVFIHQADPAPEITIDKEDGAGDEFVEFNESGFGFHFMNDTLVSIHFQSGNKLADYSMFDKPLPLGLRFEQTKSEILALLGKPDSFGGGVDDFFGIIPDWFKFKRDGYTVHIEFSLDCNSLEAIRIMNYD